MLTIEKIKRIRRLHNTTKRAEIRGAWEEYSAALDARAKLPIIQLDKPIRNGFKKYFVLRDDIAARRDADVYKRILKAINTTVYSHHEEFTQRKITIFRWKGNKRRGDKKLIQIDEIPHSLKPIGKDEWDKLGFPSYFKKYFTYTIRIHTDRWGSNYTREGWYFNYDWYFVSKIEPHYITHVQERNDDVESRFAIASRHIELKNLWPKIIHILHGSNKHKEWRMPKILREEHNSATLRHNLLRKARDIVEDKAEEKMLEAYLMSRYGFFATPYDDPHYDFNQTSDKEA